MEYGVNGYYLDSRFSERYGIEKSSDPCQGPYVGLRAHYTTQDSTPGEYSSFGENAPHFGVLWADSVSFSLLTGLLINSDVN